MVGHECLSQRRHKERSLFLLVAVLTLIGGSISIQKWSEISKGQIRTSTTAIVQKSPKPIILNRNNTETSFVGHTINNHQQERVSHQLQPPCTGESYQQYFMNGKDFANLDFPFQEECLKSLIDADPADVTLRLALVRRKYEDLQASKPRRHVVWFCRQKCGGIGDRMQQAISAFYLALAMNATFTIDMEYPVHWEDFYLGLNPIYETTSSEGGFFDRFNFSMLYKTHYTNFSLAPHLVNHTRLIKPNVNSMWESRIGSNSSFAWFHETNVEKEFFQQYEDDAKQVVLFSQTQFRIKPFQQNPYAQDVLHDYRLLDTGKGERAFLFFQLFMTHPSPHLQAAVQAYLAPLENRNVIGMQIRLGGKSVSWSDPKRHGKGCVACMAQQARTMCHDMRVANGRECAVWVTSDTPAALDNMTEKLANVTSLHVVMSNGPVSHIDLTKYQGEDGVEQNTRSFLDWYVMARYSDAFILSRSSFGEHASLYQLLNRTHFRPAFQLFSERPCTFVDFRLIQDPFGYPLKGPSLKK